MNIVIRLDVPKPESLDFMIREMANDPFVGTPEGVDGEKWIDGMMHQLQRRYEADIPATVAYHGSGIVGIALSRPMDSRLDGSNLKAGVPDYWKMGRFYVLKAYRGQGIGKRALEFFLKEKENKVMYYADRSNEASNAVAQACGMYWLHDYFQVHSSGEVVVCEKGVVVRTPAEYCRVYCGLVPPKDQLENPRLTKSSFYPSK